MRRAFVRGMLFLVVTVPLAAQAGSLNKVFFSPPLNVSRSAGDTLSYGVQVALDATGNINVVWADFSCLQTIPFTCTWHLFFRRSVDGGATFSTPKDISRQNVGDAVYAPQIAVDRTGGINVVWEDDADGGWEILFSRSVDGGVTFSTPKVISNYLGGAVDPQLAVDSLGHINVVWQTQGGNGWNWNVWFTRSVNGGGTFSEPLALCDDADICNWPQIAVEPGGGVDVVWAQALCVDCQYDVFFSRSSDGGASFSPSQNLSDSAESLITLPGLVVDGDGNIHVVWSKGDYTSGLANVFLSRSSDHGMTFATRDLSGDQGFSYVPQIVVDASGNINVFWLNDTVRGIFFSRSVDGGAGFSIPKNVSTAPGSLSATDPYVAVDSDGILSVTWQDGATGGILFSRSIDGGSTFSRPADISGHSSATYFPQITADVRGNINVVYFDEASGRQDFFLTRGVTIRSLQNDVASLPASAFKKKSHSRTLLTELARVEDSLTEGDATNAVRRLTDLRVHLNGCGASPDKNDWIVDCTGQRKIRSSVDTIIANLRTGAF
jgi:hypothetical protein